MNRFLLTSSVLVGTVALVGAGMAVNAATFAAAPDDGSRFSLAPIAAPAVDDRAPELRSAARTAVPTAVASATRSVPAPGKRSDDALPKRSGKDERPNHDAGDDDPKAPAKTKAAQPAPSSSPISLDDRLGRRSGTDDRTTRSSSSTDDRGSGRRGSDDGSKDDQGGHGRDD